MTPAQETRRIIAEIAEKHQVPVAAIMSGSRKRRYAWPRQEAYVAVREAKGYSYPHIGRIFGRDHSTVISGVRKYQERVEAYGQAMGMAA